MTLVRSESGRIWRLTLNRPAARNAVSSPMLEELTRALGDAAVDPEARVVLLSGEGPDFCAGADLRELSEAAGGPRGMDYTVPLEEFLTALVDHPLPVVAAIQGAALGAGCQIAVACDLAVAATDARLGIPSARLGVVIGFDNVQRLLLAVGPKRAGEMLLTGRELSGREAVSWGLVNEAVPPAELRDRSQRLAEEIASGAPLSVRASKRGLRAVLAKLSVDRETEGFRVTDFDMMAADALSSEDLKEGIRAFRERRRPEFRGR
ncbi:MAG TPA: enoyl-CoA hydratase/isomerase family protein [Actinomycetota bacterium]|nr:enoyl-CoA hydratase/isomerase family protein [Actinomycetota bacterium]